MKYFVEEIEGIKKNEIYAEFRLLDLKNKTSLYMLRSVTDETKFRDFWIECMREDIVFDMDTISKNELQKMAEKTERCGEAFLKCCLN